MMPSSSNSRVVLLAAMLVLIFGCSDGPAPVKVPGTVTLDGQPVAGAQVTLVLAAKDGATANAQSDAAGKFVAYARPDQYKVVVIKSAVGPNPLQSALPEKYAHVATTPFNITVPSAEPLNLALSSEGQR